MQAPNKLPPAAAHAGGSRILASLEGRQAAPWRRKALQGAGVVILLCGFLTTARLTRVTTAPAPPATVQAARAAPAARGADPLPAPAPQPVAVLPEPVSDQPALPDFQPDATSAPRTAVRGVRRTAPKPRLTAHAAAPALPAKRPEPDLPPQGAAQPPDRDVAILAALLLREHKDTQAEQPKAGRDVVERAPHDNLDTLLLRCRSLGGVEARLCQWRICAGEEGAPACRKP